MSSLPERIIKFLLLTLILSIILYGLLCTIYSDVILQNDNEFVDLSKLRLSEKPAEKNIREFIGDTSSDKNLYIFALDIGSKGINIDQVPDIYYNSIGDIEKLYNNKIAIKEDFSLLNLSKLKLYELVYDFYEKPDIYKNSVFSIWTFGNNWGKKYPEVEKRSKIDQEEIIDVLKAITKKTLEYSTEKRDFSNLWDPFDVEYKDEFNDSQNNMTSQFNIVVTFIFDLMHDIDNKKLFNINDNWEKLKRKIQEKSGSRIKLNLISLSDFNIENHKSIHSLFEENFKGNFLKRNLNRDQEDTNMDILFPVKPLDDKIIFYTLNQNSISNFPVIFNFSNNTPNDVRVSILSECNTVLPKLSFYCEIPETGQNKKLFLNDNFFDANLKDVQTLKLENNNRIFQNGITPILKISMHNERTSFLIPINFIKKLSKQSVLIFNILKNLIIFSLLSLLFFVMISVRPLWLIFLCMALMLTFIILII